MGLLAALETRSESKCELCYSTDDLSAIMVPPKVEDIPDNQVVLCANCHENMKSNGNGNNNHWRCLNESMWSQVPSVQVTIYRLLEGMKDEAWALDLKNMMFLDDETMEWVQNAGVDGNIVHKDSNGVILTNGDSVVLVQDLKVSGGGFTAKRGTAVRRIRLDPNNPNHIEGKVEGQQIVLLTQYIKKT